MYIMAFLTVHMEHWVHSVHQGNLEIKSMFVQVCVWMGIFIGNLQIRKFSDHMTNQGFDGMIHD